MNCISKIVFPKSYFQNRISKIVFPKSYFQNRISKIVFPESYFQNRISKIVFQNRIPKLNSKIVFQKRITQSYTKVEKKIFFHLHAHSEGTWHCLSSSNTIMDAKAKIFSIYLPLVKGLDIVYLRVRPPWMQNHNFFSIYLPLVKGLDIVYLWVRPWMQKQMKM